MDCTALLDKIKAHSRTLGFTGFGVAEAALDADQDHLQDWLAKGQHGQMDYMARHGDMRARPDLLQPGTLSVISVRMDYGTDPEQAWTTLAASDKAYVARYALGRDYHKLMRQRLKQLAQFIESEIGHFGYRVLVDSAPSLDWKTYLSDRQG
jgi:epoxyqueuosine reductase